MSAFGFRNHEMFPRLSVHNDLVPAPSTMTSTTPPVGRMATPMMLLLRGLMFASCVAVGIVSFTMPIQTAETITNLDELSSDNGSIANVQATLRALRAAMTEQPPLQAIAGPEVDAAELDIPPTSSLITVFVRVMSTLILLAAGGLFGPSRNVATTVAVLVDYVLALVFFVYLSVEDNGEILKMWFVVCYGTFGCGVPLLAVAYELLGPVCA